MTRRPAVFLTCLLLAAGALSGSAWATDSIRIGGDVRVTEATDGSLNAVGGRVAVDAPVSGDLRAAGGQIEIRSGAEIAGDVALAGGNITVKGPVHGDLDVAGGQITLDGPVTGDAEVAGGTLNLGPDARVSGRLRFRGGELHQDPNAQVTGGVVHTTHHGGDWHNHNMTAMQRFTRGWVWSFGLVVLAALIAAALPGPSQRLAQELRERPWVTALVGLFAITVIPIAAVLVMITIIGIPVGLLAFAVYGILLLLGYVWLAVVVGGLVLERANAQQAADAAWRVGAAALAMLALAILVRVPYIGGAFKLCALIVGVGMIVGAVFRYKKTPAAITPAQGGAQS